MRRVRYGSNDFDFAIIYIDEGPVFYILPAAVFNRYGSTVCLVESVKRQRQPRANEYRERWDLLSKLGASSGNT